MRVTPVIDLMNGQVVRAVAGHRSEYRPIYSLISADPRPATVARALVDRFGFETVYVADLDAIQGGKPNVEAWETIKNAGLKLWLDAGTGGPQRYSEIGQLLLEREVQGSVVVALETLQDPYDDRWWDETPGSAFPAIFSLDLKDGVPLRQPFVWTKLSAIEIARAAYDLCFRDMIVLDLADVGIGQGTRTLQLCMQLTTELNDVRVIAGGGVRGIDDLKALADVGCDAALVASALHDGRLSPEDIRRIENLDR
jgi:phosphoribosylformimino-5-aminoimidazole carboxamide ribotide isomerase